MANVRREEEGEMSIEEILASIRRYVGEDAKTQTNSPFVPTKSEQSYTPSRNEADKTAESLAASLSTINNEYTTENSRVPSKDYYPPHAVPSENVIRLTEAYAVKPDPQISSMPPEENGVISPQAQLAATQSFARLAEAAMRQAPHSINNDKASPTLEQLIGELAKPLVKQWLDQNLPRLVDLTVTKEIERLAKQFIRDA